MKPGAHKGVGGRGPPTRKLLACAGIHGVWLGGALLTPAGMPVTHGSGVWDRHTAATHTRFTGSGVEAGVRVGAARAQGTCG